MVAAVDLSGLSARAGLSRATVVTSVIIFLASVLASLLIDPFNWVDLRVYRLGGEAWISGTRLYGPMPELRPGLRLPFTYPPFAAVVFAPFAILPFRVALTLVIMSSLASLAASCVVMARRAGWDRRNAVLVGLTVAAIGTTAEPVRWTIFLGQVNLILLGLVAADCLASRTPWPRGLLIGIAAAIKLTPLVFVLFFLPQRQWRTSSTAIGCFVAASLLGIVVAPIDSREYWLHAALDPSRIGGIGFAGNQSLRGALHRLGLPVSVELALWLGGVTAVVIACLVAVHRLRSQGQDTVALLVVAATGLLCSPVSWSHHWVWAVPGAVLLVRRLPARSACLALGGGGLVFIVAPHWRVPHPNEPERWAIWQNIIADSYVGIALAVVLAAAIGSRHPFQRYANGGVDRFEQYRTDGVTVADGADHDELRGGVPREFEAPEPRRSIDEPRANPNPGAPGPRTGA